MRTIDLARKNIDLIGNKSSNYTDVFLKLYHYTINSPFRNEIVQHLADEVLYFENEMFSKHNTSWESRNTRSGEIFEKFIGLVKKYCAEQRRVGFYADQLCLTPKYLSTVVKEVSGKSATEWINEFVIVEAEMLLKSTNLTIQEISHKMNFPTQSFFGKYFKRVTGMAPSKYLQTLLRQN